MAKIQTYIRDTNIHNEDLLMGTSYISLNKYESRKFKVADLTDFIVQQVNTDPTNLSLKANGGIVRENDELAIDLGASSITGQLANSDLANSSITINGTAASLGSSITLDTDDVAEGTNNLYFTNARSRSAISVTGGGASYNSSTGVITLPAYFTLAQGNVTNASVSGQTLTLTRQSTSDVTFTPTANDFTNTLKTKLDGIATGAEVNVNADWNSSSGDSEILNKPTIPSGNQIIDWTQSGAGTIHASNYVDNDTIYTLPAASSSALGGIKIGYSESGKNYPVELDSNKAYVNVPWTDTVYSLPLAASGTRGGVKIGYSENGKNYPVELSSEQMYVNVPWTDTVYTLPVASSSLGGIKIGYTDNGKNYALELDGDNEAYVNVPWTDTIYTLPTASSSTLGGVKVGSNLTIDGNGVLNVGAIALTTVQTAANQTAHLALTAQEGDIVVRSDENKSYVHNGGTAGTMADYTELLTPTDAVLSVTTTDGTYINLTPNSATTGAITVAADLSAVNGTADNTARFLTKDNTWAVPAYTTDTNTQLTTAQVRAKFTAGSNITITNGEIAATDTNTNQLTEWILRDGDDDDKTVAHNKYVKFTSAVGTAGTNVSGTGTNSDPFVIAITSPNDNDNTTYSAGTGLSLSGTTFDANVDGTNSEAAQNSTTTSGRTYKVQVDSSDNLVVNVPWTDTDTNTNTTYDLSVPASTTKIRLEGSDSTDDDIEIAGGTNVTVTRNNANKLTIASTDTNTFRTIEVDGSAIGATETLDIVAGNNITLSESNGEVTIDATDTDTNTFRTVTAGGNTLGATETLAFTEGSNITITENAGAVTIASTDTNTTYSTATSSTLGLVKIGYSESGKNYPVELDANDKMYVNVPWTDTDTNTTYSTATSSTLGLVKIGYTENGKNYPVELASGKMFVNVPWTDTNTQVTNHITNNADDTATGVYSFTNTGNHKFGAGGNGNIYVGNVISASAADKGFRIHSNNADVYFDYRTDSTGSHFYRQYDGSGGIHTRFEHDITSGVFRASSDIVAYYSFSDIRLKENIKPTNYGLNELLKLNPVEFKWKEKDGKEIGLIAQEVEEIVPEVIKENKRINDDTLYKQVDYEKLVPVLINSIKELNERIKKLEDGSTK